MDSAVPPRLKRILVVDDDAAVARALTRIVQQRYAVTTTPSSQLALEALAAGDEVDAIVSDVMMPEMDGVAFYKALAIARPELTVRFVFVTATLTLVDDPFFADKILLTKPVKGVALLAALARILVD